MLFSMCQTDTPSITAKLINEQKEDKEKKNHEEKEKMKADSGFQDNYSVVVASGIWICSIHTSHPVARQIISRLLLATVSYPTALHIKKGNVKTVSSEIGSMTA